MELELGDAELEDPLPAIRLACEDTISSDAQSDGSSVTGSSADTAGHSASPHQSSWGTHGPESTAPTSWVEAERCANDRAHLKSHFGDGAGETVAKNTPDEDDVQSVASMADSIGSTDSSAGALGQAAVNYIVAKLTGDPELLQLYTEAVNKLSQGRFVANNRRLLKGLYLDISREGKTASQAEAATFLRSRRIRATISSDIFRTVTTDDQEALSLSNPPAKFWLLDQYLSSLDTAGQSYTLSYAIKSCLLKMVNFREKLGV